MRHRHYVQVAADAVVATVAARAMDAVFAALVLGFVLLPVWTIVIVAAAIAIFLFTTEKKSWIGGFCREMRNRRLSDSLTPG